MFIVYSIIQIHCHCNVSILSLTFRNHNWNMNLTDSFQGGRTPFNGQISQFAITTSQQLPPLLGTPSELTNYLAKSVFLINIGSNDYINNYLLPRRYISSHVYSGEAYADLLINNLSNQLSVNSPPHRPSYPFLLPSFCVFFI